MPKAPSASSKAATAAKAAKAAMKAAGRKVEKDPNKPKAALSAFMYFAPDMRKTLKEEQPDLAFKAVAKEIGVRWKALGEEAKKPYEAQAAVDKARHATEMEGYVAPPVEYEKAKGKKKKKKKKKKMKSSVNHDDGKDDRPSEEDLRAAVQRIVGDSDPANAFRESFYSEKARLQYVSHEHTWELDELNAERVRDMLEEEFQCSLWGKRAFVAECFKAAMKEEKKKREVAEQGNAKKPKNGGTTGQNR
jgi:hypothetical protein